MSVLRAQTAVIGAGVVGLAVARALAASGREVIIIESEDAIGTGSSSRNSEVVHAGIYYARGSLKARACVEGRRLLYTYCAERGVEHRRCGKLLVATHDDELPALTSIAERARANGLERADEELRVVSPREVAEMEPHVRCVGALHSPSTGIVDSHALMLALLGDAQSDGAELALGTRIMAAEVCVPEPTSVGSGGPTASGPRSAQSSMRMLLHTDDGTALGCDEVVNCAGHGAPELARVLAGMPQEHVPTAHFAKGNYFALAGPSPFGGLVYPLPQPAGLGVHATVDLAGRCRFGPDVEWVTCRDDGTLDLTVDPARASAFYAEVRKYWPALPDGALVPDYAGVRPKINAAGEPARDFVLSGPAEHGVRGLVHLFGIESPGLTSALALARMCVEALDGEVKGEGGQG